MGLIKWIFSFGESYRREQQKYHKESRGSKIVGLVISAIFTALGLVLEHFALAAFANNIGWGLLLSIFTVAVICSMAKMNGMYSLIAFRNTIYSAMINKANDKFDQFTAQMTAEPGEVVVTKISEEEKTARNNSRVFDIIAGFIYAIMAIGVVVGAIIMLISAIMPAG